MSIVATLDSLTGSDPFVQVEKIRKGLPARVWPFVATLVGLGKHELAVLLKLNPRTLQRRKILQSGESESFLRVIRVLKEATQMFHGDQNEAQKWLHAPAVALGGHPPIELLDTAVGTAQVLNIIRAIRWGVYL
jgi:putative toxin-antitoxin system antitoxin component (TIGR02293 family)